MSDMTDLQSEIFRPKDKGYNDGEGDESRKSVGSSKGDDYEKFSILTENELQDEAARAQEMASSILDMGASLPKGASPVSPPPKSKTRPLSQSTPPKGSKAASTGAAGLSVTGSASSLHSAEGRGARPPRPASASATTGARGGLGVAQDPDERTVDVLDVIQSKYHENLQVI